MLIFSDEEIDSYIENHITKEDDILKEINRQTHVLTTHPRMLSGHIQGSILEMLSKMIAPKNILEIGTFTGYSAICLAKGLQEKGKLTTIEINDEIKDLAQSFFDKAKLTEKIDLIIGDALDIIPKLNIEFDLSFIDGDKSLYKRYFELIIEKTKVGGFIIADNTLWGGKVIEKEIKNNDYFTKGIVEFNNYVKNCNRVEVALLPVRDGMTILRRIK